MRYTLVVTVCFLLFLPSLHAQLSYEVCYGTIDSIGFEPLVQVNQELALVCIDFKDGRYPGGEAPTDTSQLSGLNLDAVGSLGYEKDQFGEYYVVLKKYTYEDYWERLFSENEWIDERHPDYESHNGYG